MKTLMKNKLILLLFPTVIFANLIGEIQVTNTQTKDNVKDTYFANDKTNDTVLSVQYSDSIDSLEYSLKLSNRLNNSIIDRAYLKYTYNVNGINSISTKIGTLTPLTTEIDPGESTNVRIPMIYGPSGSYSNKFFAGFADSIVGANIEFKTMVDDSIVMTNSIDYGKFREFDDGKAEMSLYYYQSDLTDVSFENKTARTYRTAFNFVEYNFLIDYKKHYFEFDVNKDHGYSDLELYMMLISQNPILTPDLALVSNNEFEVVTDRVNLVHKNNHFSILYEYYNLKVNNKDFGKLVDNNSEMYYLAVYPSTYISLYGAYSVLHLSEKNLDLEENMYGIRYMPNSKWTFSTEYRKTDWVNIDNYKAYLEITKDGQDKIDQEIIMTQVIRRF